MKMRGGVPVALFTPKGKRFRFSKTRADDLQRLGLDSACIARLEKHAIPACIPGKFDQLDGDGRELLGSLADAVDIALARLAPVLYPKRTPDRVAYEKALKRAAEIKALWASPTEVEDSLHDAEDAEGLEAVYTEALVAAPSRAWEALLDLQRLLNLTTPKEQRRRNAPPEPVLAIWHVLKSSGDGEHPARRKLTFSIGEKSAFRKIVSYCYEAAGHPADKDPLRAMKAAKALLDAGAASNGSAGTKREARAKKR